MSGRAVTVDVGGRAVKLTSIDRVMWPSVGFTKGHLIDYLARVGPVMLPHVARRPLTLHRFPEGLEGKSFFQTRAPAHPPWVRTVELRFPRTGKMMDAVVLDDVAGLVWTGNIATLEIHPFIAVAGALDRPAIVVFDLDPGPGRDLADACRVALLVRDVLAAAGLESWAKTSGAKGMHVYVPLNSPTSYDDTKTFARAVAALLTRAYPDDVVDVMALARREGKVFVDWGQNDAGKSTVAPYSLRAETLPLASVPVRWEEVEAGAAGYLDPLRCLPGDVLDRVDRFGDLFEPVLRLRQSLPSTGP